jgi:hypothetical protein
LQDDSGNTVQETRTNEQGEYQFTDLPPGSYTVVEFTPANHFDGDEHVGNVDDSQLGRIAGDDEISGIVLTSGQAGVDYDFCEHAPSSLSGFVYHDVSNDGVRDSGEEPIAGVEIILLDANGNPVGEPDVTDASGAYEFSGLKAGTYSVRQVHPNNWVDGLDTAGTISGVTVGTAVNPGDEIQAVQLGWGQQGRDYNFGELTFATLEGLVHSDIVRDCWFNPQDGELPIGGVRVELLNAAGEVVQSTTTNAAGRYRFSDIAPGIYTVIELQPDGYFEGGQRAGSHGGDDDKANLISGIEIGPADHLVEYNFCEEPPGTISGFVFQDGSAVSLLPGEELPERIRDVRDGQLTSDDRRLAQVELQLRDGITGESISADAALPGIYPDGPIIAFTDADGFYEFIGLPRGNFAVYEVHPDEFIDGVDTAGTRSGVPFNAGEPVSPLIIAGLVEEPKNDAIVRISLPPGAVSEQNNFSEIQTTNVIPAPPLPVTPIPPGFDIPNVVLNPAAPILPPLTPFLEEPFHDGSGGVAGSTWHLSVIDGGWPRGDGVAVEAQRLIWFTALPQRHTGEDSNSLKHGHWILADPMGTDGPRPRRFGHFGLPGATPISGDFNGDGISEIGVFYRGEWFIDVNGNGKWDNEDLWAKLGHDGDLPVTGDWDGDGKDDIGIFGPAWLGDPRAVQREPGLPDNQNETTGEQKNVPPKEEDAASGHRIMQLTSTGKARADLIDHVFHYGVPGDVPVVGDWNGDGIDSIGVFRKGRWHLDMDGDGRWSTSDRVANFGQADDIPIVGDFNGDGIDEIGFYRDGTFYLDVNANGTWDAHDKEFVLGTGSQRPVSGDWNGDGVDEVGVFRDEADAAE